jgi:catechol 2,3-dioxygenase-like lactoylglutathione lyase family enzyme
MGFVTTFINPYEVIDVRLEHANLSVNDIDAIVAFLRVAFPEFRVRCDSIRADGLRWVHVGVGDTYIALFQAAQSRVNAGFGSSSFNHVGYEVDDVEAVRKRLLQAGYRENLQPNSHPHRKRVYFFDPEGNEWEFVQYFTNDPAKRNDYDLPDQ